MTIRKPTNRIYWYEGIGFGLLVGLTWLDFVFPLPGLVFQPGTLEKKWEQNLFISGLIAVVAILVILLTRRLVERLHRLEGLLQVCAWCGRISEQGQWLPVEDYFDQGFQIHTSHCMCPECARKVSAECSLPKTESAGS